MADNTDESLVREFVRTGSRGAFAELYYRYKDKVFNTAFRIVGEYEGARDVVHDVFLKIYVEVPGFKFKSSFSSWLYRVAVNRSLDEARRVKRRRAHVSNEPLDPDTPSGRDSDLPESSVIGKETGDELAAALAVLSPKLKTVVTLRYFEGLSYDQIAEIINRPVGTVKSRLRRAHRRLGEVLEEKGSPPWRETMDCSTCRDLMLEFVEGTLPPKVAAGVGEHIKACPQCMKELEKQSSRTRVLQSLGRVQAPDQWDEISRSIRRTGYWYSVSKYAIIAVAAIAVAAAATVLWLVCRA